MEDAQLDYAKEPHISTSLRPVSPGIFLGLKYSGIQKMKPREGGAARACSSPLRYGLSLLQ